MSQTGTIYGCHDGATYSLEYHFKRLYLDWFWQFSTIHFTKGKPHETEVKLVPEEEPDAPREEWY